MGEFDTSQASKFRPTKDGERRLPRERAQCVHLTTAHSPRDARVFAKEACTLAAAGYEVTVIAPGSNDATSEGVRFVCLPVMRSRVERFLRLPYLALFAVIRVRPAVCHFHDPELIPIGLILKLLGIRVIYDVHEDLPAQIQSKPWIPRPLRRPIGVTAAAVEYVGGRIFDAIIAATPVIAQRFPANRTVLVQNFPWPHEFQASSPIAYEQRPLHFIYAGTIAEIRGIRQVVEAFGRLPPDCTARLKLLGKIVDPGLDEELRAMPGWSRIDYLGWVPREAVARHMQEARAGIATFLPEPNHVEAQPTKLFEYMAAGLPVVASDFPLWRRLVEEHHCGRLVDPASAPAIADALIWLIDHPAEASMMSERCKKLVQEHYSWDSEAAKLLELYARLTGPGWLDSPADYTMQ